MLQTSTLRQVAYLLYHFYVSMSNGIYYYFLSKKQPHFEKLVFVLRYPQYQYTPRSDIVPGQLPVTDRI